MTPAMTTPDPADSRTTYAPGVEFAIDRISMLGNTGTYVDSPYHRYEGGADLAVLLHTGWDRHWGTPAYGDPAPYRTEAGARALVDAGARLVGIDSVHSDDGRHSADATSTREAARCTGAPAASPLSPRDRAVAGAGHRRQPHRHP
jgi:kynurenine formamidase